MLESIRKGQRWLTLLLVTFVGAVFVFFMGVGGGLQPGAPSGSAIIELGDFRMNRNDFQRLRARQEQTLREQLGDSFDAKSVASYLDAQTLSTLIDSVVLAQSAHDLGILVSDEEIQDLVLDSPSFRNESGRFDLEAFKNYAQWEYGSEANFLTNIRQDVLRQKMVSLLYEQATVSAAEARAAALYALEQVRIAYVQLELDELPAGESLGDEEVELHLAQNKDSIQVIYDETSDRYSEPERAQARHILIQVDVDATEEEVEVAREKIEEAQTRIMAGEAFDEVAEDVSEDPGSRSQGGDLGIFARGDNVKEVDGAAFTLEPGTVSDILRSAFGFHLVEVTERWPASTRPFEEVSLEIAREQATRQAAEDRAQELAAGLQADIESGQSLENAARSRDLVLERTPLLSRRPDGFVPNLGAAPDVLQEAFALDLEAPNGSLVHDLGNQLVLIQLIERVTPDPEELQNAIEAQEDSMLAAKRNGTVQQWVEERRSEWEQDGKLRIDAAAVISDS